MISQPAGHVCRIALSVLLSTAMIACSGQQSIARQDGYAAHSIVRAAGRVPTVGERAAAIAVEQIGTPYRYGGSTPQGFDCSGLVHYAYARAGKPVPRTTAQLWADTRPVSATDIQVGDLLFFRVDGKMSHVGMYVGDGRFVHAPSSGRSVSVERLQSEFYREALLRAARPN